MRIISGTNRGLKLLSLDSLETRPTLDRVKEALFSMLTPFLYSSTVLDLFAGSGALGIEALSRGSRKAVFVDNLAQAMDIIRQNISLARMNDRAVCCQINALDYLKSADESFDIIFLDPPYSGNLYEKCLTLISENNLLNHDGVIAVEWDSTLSRPCIPPSFSVLRERRYGRVMITLLTVE